MFELSFSLPCLPACPHTQAPAPSQRLLKRAERRIADKHYAKAVTDLRRAIALGADAYVYTLHIADLECRQQHWQFALCAAEQAAALAPERVVAYEMLMTISLQAGDYERAITASQSLLKLMPYHQAANDTLSAIYMRRGDVDAALRVLNTLIRLDPHNGLYQFKKGLLCQHKGEVAMAVNAFSIVLYLEEDSPLAEEAQNALEALDAFQMNQILTLGMEDLVFRTCLLRDAAEAAAERGFTLSEQGNHILADLCAQLLPHALDTCRLLRYN